MGYVWDALVESACTSLEQDFDGESSNSGLVDDTIDSFIPVYDSELDELAEDPTIRDWESYSYIVPSPCSVGDLVRLQRDMVADAVGDLLRPILEEKLEELENNYEPEEETFECDHCGKEFTQNDSDAYEDTKFCDSWCEDESKEENEND